MYACRDIHAGSGSACSAVHCVVVGDSGCIHSAARHNTNGLIGPCSGGIVLSVRGAHGDNGPGRSVFVHLHRAGVAVVACVFAVACIDTELEPVRARECFRNVEAIFRVRELVRNQHPACTVIVFQAIGQRVSVNVISAPDDLNLRTRACTVALCRFAHNGCFRRVVHTDDRYIDRCDCRCALPVGNGIGETVRTRVAILRRIRNLTGDSLCRAMRRLADSGNREVCSSV